MAAVGAQTPPKSPVPAAGAADAAARAGAVAVTPPSDYVIGPEDQLSIVFYHDKDMSAGVVVRPDGKISLPLLNDVQASGLTPDQLRQSVITEAKRFVQDPNATVVVRRSTVEGVHHGRGRASRQLSAISPTVLQLIATAGGIKEYADPRRS